MLESAPAYAILAALALQRLAEVRVAARNTKALLARGAREVGAGHYPFLIALHAAWLAAMALLMPRSVEIAWAWIGVVAVLQALRFWVMATLGPYWTTRIITLDEAPLVTTGPFRFTRHPSYAIAFAEVAALPMAFGQWRIALVFSVLNALLLAIRIRTEEAALAERRRLRP